MYNVGMSSQREKVKYLSDVTITALFRAEVSCNGHCLAGSGRSWQDSECKKGSFGGQWSLQGVPAWYATKAVYSINR